MKHAIKLKLIVANPADGIALPKAAEREMGILSPAQAKLLVVASGSHRLGAIVAVAVGGGLRQGEIFALRWRDIDLDSGTAHVRRSLSWVKEPLFKEPKSASGRRSVALPAFAVEALAARKKLAVSEASGRVRTHSRSPTPWAGR